jgi:hypothetical protein
LINASAIGKTINLLEELKNTEVISETDYQIRLAGIKDVQTNLIDAFEYDNERFNRNKFNSFIENLLKI